jgi:predicted phosphoribosyltransferase
MKPRFKDMNKLLPLNILNFISKILDGSIIRFKDRENAAEMLCSILKDNLTKIQSNESLILGITRGGIILGDIISRKFGYPFHIVIPRKLAAPHNRELAIGGIMKDNTIYLDTSLMKTLKINNEYLDIEKQRKLEEIKKIEAILGKQVEGEKLKEKNIILVDDGVATGATLLVTSRWIRKYEPKNLTIATPICPHSTLSLLKKETDYVASIINPSSRNFDTVENFYQKFEQLEIEKLNYILKKYKL